MEEVAPQLGRTVDRIDEVGIERRKFAADCRRFS